MKQTRPPSGAGRRAPYVQRGRAPIAPPPPAARATANVLRGFSKTFGAGLGEIATRWPEIVGERMARLCTPVKITGRDGEGALHVAARGPGAMLVEAEAANILERVNAFAGRVVAKRLAITRASARPSAQETNAAQTKPARTRLEPAAAPKQLNLTPTQKLALEAELKDVDNPRLRAALFALGKAARSAAKTDGGPRRS